MLLDKMKQSHELPAKADEVIDHLLLSISINWDLPDLNVKQIYIFGIEDHAHQMQWFFCRIYGFYSSFVRLHGEADN